MNTTNRVTGKIVLFGVIETLSPVHIGSGRADHSEMDIIRIYDGTPFIPASGFIGVLRHAFPEKLAAETSFKTFWGYAEDEDGRQSNVFCSDLHPVAQEAGATKATPKVTLRDGIRINKGTGLVEKTGKFDFEILEPGLLLKFHLEITLRHNEPETGRYIRTVYDLLKSGHVLVGAKTNNGFGKIKLVENKSKIYKFDFKSKKDVYAWLMRDFAMQTPCHIEEFGEPFVIEEKKCSISVLMKLKSSLIVRSYANEPEKPDATQLRSNRGWVLPGSSVKGAIRGRAERIVNTLGLINGLSLINGLFGDVKVAENGEKKEERRKGRLCVDDVILPLKDFPTELQSRIRIDRFTGGVITGALFDSMPVFSPQNGDPVAFYFEIKDYRDEEIGLLLLILKDLWSGDLAIGGEKNIGRGVFQGECAKIVWDGRKVVIDRDFSKLSQTDQNVLQKFVDALTGSAGHA